MSLLKASHTVIAVLLYFDENVGFSRYRIYPKHADPPVKKKISPGDYPSTESQGGAYLKTYGYKLPNFKC